MNVRVQIPVPTSKMISKLTSATYFRTKSKMILAICQRGHNRSGAVKNVLDDRRNLKDVVQLGVDTTTVEFMRQMMSQADKIIVAADQSVLAKVPAGFEAKIIYIDIGPDSWGRANDPALLDLVDRLMLARGI